MSKTNSARKEIDIIDMLSYDSGHAAGYVEGRMDGYEIGYKECAKKYRKMKKIRKKKIMQFLSNYCLPKCIGVLLLIFTVFTIKVLDGEATFAILSVPLACGLIFRNNIKWFRTK